MVARSLFAAAVCAALSGVALADTLSSKDGCSPCPGSSNTNDVILEAREVSRISDKMHAAEVALNGWKLKRRGAQEFQEHQEKSLKEQIKTQEHSKGISGHDVETHKTSKKQKLVHQMCTLVFNAFEFKDKKSETKLVKLCMGRDDLALVSQSRALRGGIQGPSGDEEEALTSSPKVQAMQKEYDSLQAKVKEARDAYWADTEKWAKQRQELGDNEASLGEAAADLAEGRWAATDDAWEEVKADWCPPFNSGEETILPFARKHCE